MKKKTRKVSRWTDLWQWRPEWFDDGRRARRWRPAGPTQSRRSSSPMTADCAKSSLRGATRAICSVPMTMMMMNAEATDLRPRWALSCGSRRPCRPIWRPRWRSRPTGSSTSTSTGTSGRVWQCPLERTRPQLQLFEKKKLIK